MFHYLPDGHRIAVISRHDLRRPLVEAAFAQGAVEQASVIVVSRGR